jgi:hypothetical protein
VRQIVERDDVPVMFERAADDQAAITRAWAELEDAVGSPRGRRFYGVFDPAGREYRACVELREGDHLRGRGWSAARSPAAVTYASG